MMRALVKHLAVAALGVLIAGPAGATTIERVVSPGGIEAWLVREPSVPLIAINFGFVGGANEDPADKPGVAAMVADLLDEGAGTLTLDLSDVGFVDSSGLGVLVALHRHAEARGARFVVRSVPPAVQRLFEITRLGDLLTIDGA